MNHSDHTFFDGKFCEITEKGLRQVHPLVINKKDGSVMVLIPAGEFKMGDGKDTNCPEHTVSLDAYYIGVYTVSNRQYALFVKETGHRAPETADFGGVPVWKNGRCPEEKLDHPVVCVSWDDAQAYTEWAGCMLPTEAQWEKAARCPKGYLYPWGNEWDEGKCRHDGNKGNGSTCPVCGYPEGASGYGTYNQSGNVWEWCRDWYDGDYYKKGPRENPGGPDRGSRRVYRGGGWWGSVPAYLRAANRWNGPSDRDDSLGFRLVRQL